MATCTPSAPGDRLGPHCTAPLLATPGEFGAVVALKATAHAKSRLGSLPDPLRRRLAWTMAVDTLTAVSAVAMRMVVVSDQPGLATALKAYGLAVPVLAESGQRGLNAALAHGAEHLRADGPVPVFACVGDLPALAAASLRQVLRTASSLPRCYLADASGIGTTMLCSTTEALDPRFQGRSAAAHHASGAVPLSDELLGGPVPDARRDVDSEVDLDDAFRLGLGRMTAALFDPQSRSLGRYQTVTVAGPAGDDHSAITADGYRVLLPRGAVDPTLRTVHAGQRLHAAITDDRALSAWL